MKAKAKATSIPFDEWMKELDKMKANIPLSFCQLSGEQRQFIKKTRCEPPKIPCLKVCELFYQRWGVRVSETTMRDWGRKLTDA